MSKHSTSALTMRDALYEAPGPEMRAKIRIGTAISLVAVAALAILVLQRFYVTGQLSVHDRHSVTSPPGSSCLPALRALLSCTHRWRHRTGAGLSPYARPHQRH